MRSTGSAPYIIVTYTTNTAPGTPTLVGPANGATIAVGSQPAFSFTGYDVDQGDTIASFDIAIDDAADFATPVYFATIAPPGAESTPRPRPSATGPTGACPRSTAGGTYYWRVRTETSRARWAPAARAARSSWAHSHRWTPLSPAASTLADIWNLDELAMWTSGGSHARPIVSFRYLHPAGLVGHPLSGCSSTAMRNTLVYDSGAGRPRPLPIGHGHGQRGLRHHQWHQTSSGRCRCATPTATGPQFPATQTFKVRWGQGIFAQNMGAGASGLKFAAGGLTGTTAGMALAFMSSDDCGAGPPTPRRGCANVGSLPIGRGLRRTMVRLNTATSGQNPSLPDITLTYTTRLRRRCPTSG